MTDIKEDLKKRVIDFVKSRPTYDAQQHETLNAFCEDEDNYIVIYGVDLMAGVADE